MAVATDNGLMVPVLRNCEELNFLGLCRKVNSIAKNTRDKKLKPDDLQGLLFQYLISVFLMLQWVLLLLINQT